MDNHIKIDEIRPIKIGKERLGVVAENGYEAGGTSPVKQAIVSDDDYFWG